MNKVETAVLLPEDAELAILENIYSSERKSGVLTQRELAEVSGLSLGMTNVILKRFAQKGWVMLRKINSRTVQYALTPSGVNEIAHRTYRYFRRTARNTNMYKGIIEEFIMKRKQEGKTRLVLAGISDIDFIFEYACEKQGILFVKVVNVEKADSLASDGNTVLVRAEGLPEGNGFGLADILLGKIEEHTTIQ